MMDWNPTDKQSDIFKEFTQVENKNYSYKGTGLGLTIVKKSLNCTEVKYTWKVPPETVLSSASI